MKPQWIYLSSEYTEIEKAVKCELMAFLFNEKNFISNKRRQWIVYSWLVQTLIPISNV